MRSGPVDSDIVEFVVLGRLGPYLRSMLADLEIEDRGLPRVSSSYANPINSHCYNCWPRSSERDVRSSRSDAYPAAEDREDLQCARIIGRKVEARADAFP